ncbi:membrane protein [Planotetraspora silvatica]|uniref:Membrane protein n=1 Tax=Planotetraspora silvatica TaxID=234614 RepID=A0A8J3UFS9_9ACTN|nr:membrane protein [Planotetraspora silvatica]
MTARSVLPHAVLEPLAAGAPSSHVDAAVVAVVLGAALLHATWNAIAHGSPDRLTGFALIGIPFTAIGVIGVAINGLPPAGAWPFIVISSILTVTYQLLLLASYQLGQFSQTYPLARGTSPWVVAVVSTTLLGQELSWTEAAGVAVVSIGLMGLVFIGGRPDRAHMPALAAAFATGVMIAAYTTVDGVGVQHAPMLTYASWLFLFQGPVLPLIAVVRRGRALPGLMRPSLAAGLGGGVASLLAYGLVLWAQTRGALAPIAALRETSIIFGAIIAAVFLGERFGSKRALASAVVVAGIILINLS